MKMTRKEILYTALSIIIIMAWLALLAIVYTLHYEGSISDDTYLLLASLPSLIAGILLGIFLFSRS